MIWINFGKWDTAARRVFTYKRIYFKKYKWTPFVWIKIRYKPWHKCLLGKFQ